MPKVHVEQGWLEGERAPLVTKDGFYNCFKGIPYAAPPIGKLHFKAPQSPILWKGNEDCLYLNVYTPELTPKHPLPLMFFIHSGGYKCGSGNTDNYGPDFLVKEEVVLVTINYRVEVLGFLCLENKDVPGNAEMKDQVAALRWVQKNISNFGGDPNNVTIFGESAGGGSVGWHILSPMSKGLFQRAILMSGSPFVTGAILIFLDVLSPRKTTRNVYGNQGRTNCPDLPGASHLDDLSYLFDPKRFSLPIDMDSKSYKMIKQTCALFANFAKCGNPTPRGSKLGVTWLQYDPNNRNYLDIGETLTPGRDLGEKIFCFKSKDEDLADYIYTHTPHCTQQHSHERTRAHARTLTHTRSRTRAYVHIYATHARSHAHLLLHINFADENCFLIGTYEVKGKDENEEAQNQNIKVDRKAKSELILAISSTELRHVRGCGTSCEVWVKLMSVYALKGPARKALLLKQLMLHKVCEVGDVRDHLNKFCEIVYRLSAMDNEANQDLLCVMLLYCLSDSYEIFKYTIKSLDELLNVDAFKVKIFKKGAVESQAQQRQAQPHQLFAVDRRRTIAGTRSPMRRLVDAYKRFKAMDINALTIGFFTKISLIS
ncbi:Esterase B1 [Eumeta japonica]|uniref:Carboxylic ester hydrolase n=1 Tax=Eumeta variegata TaxID=151549 RepID=A0A4C1X9K0_EUMVA|nr:Esterase B1 [Eumeta japonica]